jgi:hypothetical protein
MQRNVRRLSCAFPVSLYASMVLPFTLSRFSPRPSTDFPFCGPLLCADLSFPMSSPAERFGIVSSALGLAYGTVETLRRLLKVYFYVSEYMLMVSTESGCLAVLRNYLPIPIQHLRRHVSSCPKRMRIVLGFRQMNCDPTQLP